MFKNRGKSLLKLSSILFIGILSFTVVMINPVTTIAKMNKVKTVLDYNKSKNLKVGKNRITVRKGGGNKNKIPYPVENPTWVKFTNPTGDYINAKFKISNLKPAKIKWDTVYSQSMYFFKNIDGNFKSVGYSKGKESGNHTFILTYKCPKRLRNDEYYMGYVNEYKSYGNWGEILLGPRETVYLMLKNYNTEKSQRIDCQISYKCTSNPLKY